MSDTTPLTPGQDAPAAADPTAARASGSGRIAAFGRGDYAQATNRGYGESMARGLELAITLLVMVGIGWVLDRIFGTFPTCTIVLSILGFAGTTVKLWLGYDLEMRRHEEGAVWNRGRKDAA